MILDSAVKFKKAFDRLNFIDDEYTSYLLHGSEENHEGHLIDIDQKNASIFIKFLKIFYDTTLNLGASTHVIAHRYAHYLHSIEFEMYSIDFHLRLMADNIKLKFDIYWGDLDIMNKLIYVVVVLYPSYKLKNLSFLFKYNHEFDVAKKLVGVQDVLVRLYAYYNEGSQNSGIIGSLFVNSSTYQSKKSTTR